MEEQQQQSVVIIDDDRSILLALEELLSSNGYQVRTYDDPELFFTEGLPPGPACLLLDNQLAHGMTGVRVHQDLQDRGWHIPTIFLTAHWNIKSVVAAMRSGADDFLSKPFEPVDLLNSVCRTLENESERLRESSIARSRLSSLTRRERQIVSMVVGGRLNKEIADQLDLALVTIKVHRGRAMKKLGAGNPAELARIVTLAELT